MSETHLELDALADLLVGEGTDADVDHVAGCDRCAARLTELDDAQEPVTAALRAYAEQPVPAPPADLGSRLAAALEGVRPDAADPLPTAPAAALTDDDGDRTPPVVVPFRPRAPRGRGVLGVAAAAAGLVAVVGLGLAVTSSSGGSDDSAGSAAEAPVAGSAEDSASSSLPAVTPVATGTDYRGDPTALSAALPALLVPQLADTSALSSSSGSSGGEGTTGDEAAGGAAQSSAGRSSTLAAPAPAAAADALARLRDPSSLQGCVAAVAPAGPLAVDYASFEGRPAVLLVLPGSRPATVDVVAVGPDCGVAGRDELYRTQLPRP